MSLEVRVHDHSTTEDPAWPIAGDKASKTLFAGNWVLDPISGLWIQMEQPLSASDAAELNEILELIHLELKKINLHLASLSGEEVEDEDAD